MDKLIANIYWLSDNAVIYSVKVKWHDIFNLQEEFIGDHELLDGIYHTLQTELNIEGKEPIDGRTLFETSEIQKWDKEECHEMVEEMKTNYEKIKEELESYLKSADIWLQMTLWSKLQSIKEKIANYRDFMDGHYMHEMKRMMPMEETSMEETNETPEQETNEQMQESTEPEEPTEETQPTEETNQI